MRDKDLKSKEERIWEMYIKAYISETQFYKMLERVKKEVKTDGENI